MHIRLYTDPFKLKITLCEQNAGAYIDACAATGSSDTISDPSQDHICIEIT